MSRINGIISGLVSQAFQRCKSLGLLRIMNGFVDWHPLQLNNKPLFFGYGSGPHRAGRAPHVVVVALLALALLMAAAFASWQWFQVAGAVGYVLVILYQLRVDRLESDTAANRLLTRRAIAVEHIRHALKALESTAWDAGAGYRRALLESNDLYEIESRLVRAIDQLFVPDPATPPPGVGQRHTWNYGGRCTECDRDRFSREGLRDEEPCPGARPLPFDPQLCRHSPISGPQNRAHDALGRATPPAVLRSAAPLGSRILRESVRGEFALATLA